MNNLDMLNLGDSKELLKKLSNNSLDALISDPPYGIFFKNNKWDKTLPSQKIWTEIFRILKPGSFGLIFSSIINLHKVTQQLENEGFLIKDLLFYAFLNGMPKSRNIGIDIDKALGVKSKTIGNYKYKQGYSVNKPNSYKQTKEKLKPQSKLGSTYNGFGIALKPFYEPIIMVQKPISEKNIAQNIIKWGVGALNFEDTRIPYGENDKQVGHNPHEKGRVAGNIIRTEIFNDGYDKFFLVKKVRNFKHGINHPTMKPLDLMNHLVKLITIEKQIILDPFMGTGSTGISARGLNRKFIGIEIEKDYFKMCLERFNSTLI